MVARWRGRWRKAQAASATGAGGDEVHVNVWWHRATRQRQRAQAIEWGEEGGERKSATCVFQTVSGPLHAHTE